MQDKTSIEKCYTIDTGKLPAISANFTRATTLELQGLGGKSRICVHSSGKVELINCSDADEAARIFWSAVECMGLKLATPEAAPAAVAVPDGGTPGLWSVRKREVDGELRDCFVTAPDCQGLPYDAEIMGDDEYRDDNGIARKLADCELIVTAVNAYRAALAATPAAAPVDKSPELQGSVVDKTANLQGSAAAPVVLPEPVVWRESLSELVAQVDAGNSADYRALQEHRIMRSARALLATATGLPAQAPMQCVECKSCGAAYDIDSYQAGYTDGKGHCPECPAVDQTAAQAQADARDAALSASEQDALRLVRQAVRDFHYALDNRKHGGVAAGAAMNAIELALNMYWQQGQEADRRASLAAQGSEK